MQYPHLTLSSAMLCALRMALPTALAACGMAALAQTSTDTWSWLASEGQTFNVAGTQTVRYGAGSTWLTKSVTNSGQCNKTFFSGDPAYGVAKHCELAVPAAAASIPSVAPVCSTPMVAVNTSTVAPVVGNGTPESCTEAALRTAIASHSTISFNCGALPVTIPISQTIDVPTDRNIVIDGGHMVTLDGLGTTRILSMMRQNYRSNANQLTLQRITLANGKATGTRYVPPDPNNPSCAHGWADGAGGGIQVRDAKLAVIDSTFLNNAAATPGPDVGGGAIYAAGSLGVTIVNSTFLGNSGSNGGAVGLLQTEGRFYNSVFANNVASGVGRNFKGGAATGCPGVGHANQGGAGGNAGAVYIDGSDDTDVMVCGARFVDNRANELAGALIRTANVLPRSTTIDRSVFRGNSAMQGGALYVQNAKPLDIKASTFGANVANVGGAAHLVMDQLNVLNSTFADNQATKGLGGALLLSSPDASGVIRNATFSGNKATGGAGYFGAAIAGGANFPIYNTVFANNVTAEAWSPMQCWFSAGSGSSNMQWPPKRVVGGLADTPCVVGIVFADPQLRPLAENGGPTPTVWPSSTSPLRGAGRNCPPTDQRGKARNTAQCTMGAVE